MTDTLIPSDVDEWLGGLDPGERPSARRLLAELTALGCPDPLVWAWLEFEFDLPQLARFRFLHGLAERVAAVRTKPFPAAERLVNAGADPELVAALTRTVAEETVGTVLRHLSDADRADGQPSWVVVEVGASGRLTGRRLADLDDYPPSNADGESSGAATSNVASRPASSR